MTDQEALVVVRELFGEIGCVRVRYVSSGGRTVESYEIGWLSRGYYFFCTGDSWEDAVQYMRDNPEPGYVTDARIALLDIPLRRQSPRDGFAKMLGL